MSEQQQNAPASFDMKPDGSIHVDFTTPDTPQAVTGMQVPEGHDANVLAGQLQALMQAGAITPDQGHAVGEHLNLDASKLDVGAHVFGDKTQPGGNFADRIAAEQANRGGSQELG